MPSRPRHDASSTGSSRWVMPFSAGNAGLRDLLGGKGANLAEMTRLGLPVPPGFTVTTSACRAYSANGEPPSSLWDEVESALKALEPATGKRFGDPTRPLLLSVRSGAAISMPGMMDTILNIGLNDDTLMGLGGRPGNALEGFALDSYARVIEMFGRVVREIPAERFAQTAAAACARAGVASVHDLPSRSRRQLVTAYQSLIAAAGDPFPADPTEQLQAAILAVFRSWNTPRAIAYRRTHGISDDLGTAATVQAMVFGNLGETSGTGVAFTRDPNTGAPGIFGEFLANAQGEDVVAGTRTPIPLTEMADDPRWWPSYTRLVDLATRLEAHDGDMQDIEFTIEEERLYLLQTRRGQRSAPAAVRIAVDLVKEGAIDRPTAISRISPAQLELLLHARLDENAPVTVIATGLPASPGAASGHVVFDPDAAQARAEAGEAIVLVRPETAAEDFPAMAAVAAILTTRGGMTSHAAVVARGMGKPTITGAESIQIDLAAGTFRAGETTVREGDEITVDGSSGRVILGRAPLVQPDLVGDIQTLLVWADDERRLGVRANADTPADAARARSLGAGGIGLCRTEHMFFGEDRIAAMRTLILAEDQATRDDALSELEAFQFEDFRGIFRAMDGLPVVIRTLDPPLHEFLPHGEREIADLALRLWQTPDAIRTRIAALQEVNPMLGHRGVRLGISRPEITRMQTRAIVRAALACVDDHIPVYPQIMVPLVADPEELRRQRTLIESTAAECFAEAGRRVHLEIGTMIELPRAALLAGEIAAHADFMSFGTNDLTQMTFGLSRDDAGRFLPDYLTRGILAADPFRTIDQAGVGELVRIGVERGRTAKPNLSTGICGEHGGDPASIAFCHAVGLDYVSCSPFRVPIARLAAAHATLAESAAATIETGRSQVS